MRTGKANQRIRFEQQLTETDATYGPQPGDWIPVCTVWAEVQDVLPSRAETTADIRIASRPARVRLLRYRSDITSAMRIVLVDRGNRVLNIVAGPAEMGRKEGLELMAQEFSTAGDAA